MIKRNLLKRCATLLLAGGMIFGFTACGNHGGEDNGSDSGGSVQSGNEYEGTKKDKFTGDGKLIVEYFGVDMDTLQSRSDDTQLIMDTIENKFQVSFKIMNGSASSWKTQLNQYIGGGDVPDIFFHTRDEPSYSGWLEEMYLFNYSRMLDDYPNLKKAFERFPADGMKNLLGGDYYSYPIVMNDSTGDDIINEHALYYRRDWYEALKAKNWKPSSGRALVDPETENFNYLNFYDLMEGFTKGDPDGNGKEDTYGYAGTKEGGIYWWYPLLSMWGVNTDGWYKNDKGEWRPECISDEYKNAVLWIADMYDNGLINSNYATTATQAVMKNDFVNGVAGMMTYNATYPMGKGILDLMETFAVGGKSLSDVCRAMPVVTGVDGTKKMWGYPNYYGFLAINNDVTVNKKQKILSIMDWMLSEEGMMVLNYGIEGKHYKLKADKTIESLLGNDTSGFPKTLYNETVAPGIYRIKGMVSWSTPIPDYIEHYTEQMQLLTAWKSDYFYMDELAYASVGTDYALKISQLGDSTDKAFKEIVTSISGNAAAKKETREGIWNSYVNKYLKQGDGYIKAMNDAAKTQLGL